MSAHLPSAERRASLVETLSLAAGSAFSFLLGLLRTKAQALAWGPRGLGVSGLMQSSMSTATLIGGGGVDGLLARELAADSDLAHRQRLASAALRGMPVVSVAVAGVGLVVFFVLGEPLGFSGPLEALLVALGVWAGIASANLRAVLVGCRVGARFAVDQVAAAGLATVVVCGLAVLPSAPLSWSAAVAVIPLSQWLVFWRRANQLELPALAPWGPSLRFAVGYMSRAGALAVAGVLPMLSQLLVRAVANRELGPDAFGAFQAAMTLAALSVSVLASSVGPSVLPRLSAVTSDNARLGATIEMVVLDYLRLYAPLALGMAALPELVTQVVFSSEFHGVIDQLPWQMVGEVFRLPCWVMATALAARGRYRAFLLVEVTSLVLSVAAVAWAGPRGSPALMGAAASCTPVVLFFLLVGLLWRDQVQTRLRTFGALFAVAALVAGSAALARDSLVVRGASTLVAVLLAASALHAVRTILRRS